LATTSTGATALPGDTSVVITEDGIGLIHEFEALFSLAIVSVEIGVPASCFTPESTFQ
jgi:hypothetical protein